MFTKEKREGIVHRVGVEQAPPRILVSIDAGKDATKCLLGEEALIFKTRVLKSNDLNQVSAEGGQAFLVKYDGETYVVGDELNAEPNLEMTKTLIEHKICVYSAIAKMVPQNATVDLALGIPILLYLDEPARLAYLAYMSQSVDKEWIEITVGGKICRFKLGHIQILPETSGYVFSHYVECANRLTGVLDIGGLNVNGCIFDGFNPIYSSCFTINRGGHHLRKDIQQKLIQRLGRDIQDYQMNYILNNPSKTESPIVELVVREYLESILKLMKIKNWDLEGVSVVLTGGTSKLVQPYAEEYIPRLELSDNPVWDNVIGFQIFTAQILEG